MLAVLQSSSIAIRFSIQQFGFPKCASFDRVTKSGYLRSVVANARYRTNRQCSRSANEEL
jgi:transposase-like protein